jgi:hypothetical protein
MGRTNRREQVIIIPEGYWTSIYDNINWVYKEKSAKTTKRNTKL